ncbi:MAG TPA: hypothetical protein VHE34_27740 [Puia sp.]|uniref:hypothetical protein n=1 Tax=Puia sp. TaxID=2045100 RepID=UPI002BA44BE9|nr:hypothetical protein [Puia sp.]HVU99058.1 hypothetical protein [Puia sp.]
MTSKPLTKTEIETARGGIFHMVLFSMAWVMIGEYALDFRDHIIAAGTVLAAAVILGFYSISLYYLEDCVGNDKSANAPLSKNESRTASRYAIIFILEGIAVMATWTILIRTGHEKWLVSCFALIAGLHFFPLARAIRVHSYYFLGAWIILVCAGGYWLVSSGSMAQYVCDASIAYGCAAGAIADGTWIATRTERRVK